MSPRPWRVEVNGRIVSVVDAAGRAVATLDNEEDARLVAAGVNHAHELRSALGLLMCAVPCADWFEEHRPELAPHVRTAKERGNAAYMAHANASGDNDAPKETP